MYYIGKLLDFLYNIKYGISNLIKWFPIIWNDRQYDQSFFVKILNKKISLIYGFYHSDNCAQRIDTTLTKALIKKIKICKNLLNRLEKDEYSQNAFYFHDKKYGEFDFEFSDGGMKTVFHKPLTDKEKRQEEISRGRLYKHSDKMRQDDINMLFKILAKHFDSLWD